MISQHWATIINGYDIRAATKLKKNVEQTTDAFGLDKKLQTVIKVLKCEFTTWIYLVVLLTHKMKALADWEF